jgi:hypothetical protein
MKKIVRLTERDLTRLVKRVIKEDEESMKSYKKMLSKIESDLDKDESDLDEIQNKLYDFDNLIWDEDTLDEDEKEKLSYYIGELLKRCVKPKNKGFGKF